MIPRRTLNPYKQKLSEMGVDVPKLWNDMKGIIVKTVISAEKFLRISLKSVTTPKNRRFAIIISYRDY